MKKFAAFDIDGTLFRWQLFHELVFELKRQDYFAPEIADQLEKSYASWKTKEGTWHDYEMTVIKHLHDALTNISPSAFEHAAEIVVNRSGKKLYGYTHKLLEKLHKEGYFLIALSGSQQEIAERFAEIYNFDICIGTLYEREGDRFTGKITRFVPNNKADFLKKIIERHDLTLEGSIAVGDSGGDIDMLEMVENPIAFNPASDLLDTAISNGWQIVVERKDIAYTLKRDDNGTYILAETATL